MHCVVSRAAAHDTRGRERKRKSSSSCRVIVWRSKVLFPLVQNLWAVLIMSRTEDISKLGLDRVPLAIRHAVPCSTSHFRPSRSSHYARCSNRVYLHACRFVKPKCPSCVAGIYICVRVQTHVPYASLPSPNDFVCHSSLLQLSRHLGPIPLADAYMRFYHASEVTEMPRAKGEMDEALRKYVSCLMQSSPLASITKP